MFGRDAQTDPHIHQPLFIIKLLLRSGPVRSGSDSRCGAGWIIGQHALTKSGRTPATKANYKEASSDSTSSPHSLHQPPPPRTILEKDLGALLWASRRPLGVLSGGSRKLWLNSARVKVDDGGRHAPASKSAQVCLSWLLKGEITAVRRSRTDLNQKLIPGEAAWSSS